MLVVGVLFGVLLGPAVLGRLAPDLYDPMFLGSGDMTPLQQAQAELDRFLNDADTRQDRIDRILKQAQVLGQGDSAQIATQEQVFALTNAFAEEQASLQASIDAARLPILANQQTHRDKLSGMATIMLLIIVILFAAESILSPQREELEQGKVTPPNALSRLITIRYGLASGWLMIMLAQPVWLKGINLAFGGLLLSVVLIAGLTPLRKQAESH